MTLPLIRSKLFVPGSRPELFAKALAGEADAISIDLEDAVSESRKAEARLALTRFLRSGEASVPGKTVIVRVNALDTPHFEADIDACAWPAMQVLNLPKAESAEDVRKAARALERREAERGIERPIGILANIESPRGLRLAAEIAAADPRVVGLQLGFGDLLEPLGIDRGCEAAIQQLQLSMRLAAGEAGLPALDSAFANVKDPEGYRREAENARRLGYMGKTCIHPSQVALANAAFRPGDAEIERALRVVEAWDTAQREGTGALLVDGRMIDLPFAKRAQAIVALARQLGCLPAANP
ncbi:citrate lyase subunit beta / citryl-CoA lyase [Noviherbaspirillum humi]|uniref:Citrate lyase subunit beta / citryl-CoA lyase n=1 Tax=Noviherbaspirillum humi TaxID=1688639 RepID=A0A239EXQ7_9BURK|nr:citrate lyase subunit beta / citryl-CoA lyase [Noviherbaspirillum humi]